MLVNLPKSITIVIYLMYAEAHDGQKKGDRLTDYRRKSGLSQDELAEKLNVSRQAVSNWERGEKSPDTDNLIKLSKIYGVTIDEMLLGEGEVTLQSNNKEYKNTDIEKTGESFHIGLDGIHIEDADDLISITSEGIHIKEKHGDDFRMGMNGIHFNGDNVESNELHKKLTASYPILMMILFLVFGFLGHWDISWIFFLTVPVYSSLVSAILYKDARRFLYPVLLTTVYVFLGMQYGRWHPWWIMFLTVPLYYVIVNRVYKNG